MSSEIKQGQAINAAVAFIQETKSKLDSINKRTVHEARAQSQGGWEGQGGNAFRGVMDTFEQKATTITNALDELTAGLEKARKLGTEADDETAGQSSAVRSTIEGTNFSF
ncbi:WXG100 family type VII secretion target [Nocardioides albus]|uniref:WXG100 family type VII secretion target n=1 Tax=Nocardioides albus TaxID=1841 RepID=A0A7W5A2A7_9ACTN|nr:WXG100 family type VII secretion target [Nocardioides albus]MBB3088191.1 WXG100 family type VII secretion target [Nocardioides albus]GGU23095.1 hypothetical protein GCM10007979_22580 [Nocardioides albus]